MPMSSETAVRNVNPRLLKTLTLMVSAALSKEIANNVAEPLKTQIINSADQTINSIIDDYCATGAHNIVHKPLPGPSGVALDLATALAAFANITAQAGGLRDEVMKIAGTLTQQAYKTSGL